MNSSVESTHGLKLWHYAFTLPALRTKRSTAALTMENLTESACFRKPANEPVAMPSLPVGTGSAITNQRAAFHRTIWRSAALILLGCFLAGCSDTPAPEKPAAETKPALTVPDDVQSAADSLLGKETTVLLIGDLAKTGKQQFLAANVVPKSTKNNLPGTIVTRSVVAENDNGQWTEILRCDEHLKNQKGFLPGTPIGGVTGWRLAFEQDPEKGLALYFTPLKGAVDTHSLPIGVRWNPKTERYQSLDRSYEHFLNEAPSLNTARSNLR
jgi:hypothetical protein